MVNTYTSKLNLAKPAHGDVNWHIPVNENWDKIDTELDKALKISGTTIDADKDWNGKNITNLGYIATTRIRPVASDEVRWGPKQYIWTAGGWSPTLSLQVVIPSIYIEGTAKLTLKGHSYYTDYPVYQQVGITVNGVSVAQWSTSDGTLHEYVYPIKGGDVIVFWSDRVWGTSGGFSDATVQLSDTAPIIYPAPPTWPS